ncbi:MAG: MFS transporter [bacterium]
MVRKRLIEFFGLKRSITGLLGMVVLVGLGEKMAERFLPIYLLALGSGALLPGLLNALDNLLSALYSFPGGYLSDRLGVKRALLVFNLLAMVGFVIVIAVPSWPAVIVGSFFFLSWTAISLPATMDLVASVLPKHKRTMGVSVHSLVRRIPMALGPIMGGVFIDIWGEVTGVRLAFVGALIMAGLAVIVQQSLIEGTPRGTTTEKVPRSEANPFRLWREMHPSLKTLLVSDILIRFCEQIPYAYVVIWCMKDVAGIATAGISGKAFGLLTAVEMVTAMLIYIPVAYLADKGNKKPYVLITFINFTLFPLVLFYSRSMTWLVVAFILRGLKEFGEPTRKALIMDLAPEGKKAAMFGTYYLFRDIVVSIGAGAGAFLWQLSPQANFMGAVVCGAIGTLWFAFLGRAPQQSVSGP